LVELRLLDIGVSLGFDVPQFGMYRVSHPSSLGQCLFQPPVEGVRACNWIYRTVLLLIHTLQFTAACSLLLCLHRAVLVTLLAELGILRPPGCLHVEDSVDGSEPFIL
jgi:hypothetical protein